MEPLSPERLKEIRDRLIDEPGYPTITGDEARSMLDHISWQGGEIARLREVVEAAKEAREYIKSIWRDIDRHYTPELSSRSKIFHKLDAALSRVEKEKEDGKTE